MRRAASSGPEPAIATDNDRAGSVAAVSSTCPERSSIQSAGAHLSRIRNARQMRNQLRQRPRTIQQRNQVRVDATFDWPVSGVRQQHHLAAAENVQR